jgi:hypothetical protein
VSLAGFNAVDAGSVVKDEVRTIALLRLRKVVDS